MDDIRPGLYRHYKGNLYQVIGICRHSETHEECVVYQALYGDYGLWIRPLTMFAESVMHNGQKTPRFSFVHDVYGKAPKCQ